MPTETITIRTYAPYTATPVLIATETIEVEVPPPLILGQHQPTHQIAVGGTTLRVGSAPESPAIARLDAATHVHDTGQRVNAGGINHALVIADLGTGYVPAHMLIRLED